MALQINGEPVALELVNGYYEIDVSGIRMILLHSITNGTSNLYSKRPD